MKFFVNQLFFFGLSFIQIVNSFKIDFMYINSLNDQASVFTPEIKQVFEKSKNKWESVITNNNYDTFV